MCTAGKRLTPGAAALLRVFGQRQAVFRLKLVKRWDAGSEEVVRAGRGAGTTGSGDEDEESDESEDEMEAEE